MFLIFFSSLFAGQPRPSRRIDALGAGRAGSKHRKPPASIRAEVSGPPEVYKIAQPNIQAGRLHATRWQWEQGCWERHIRRDKPARACCAERGNALGRAKRSAAAEWAHATDASGAIGMPTTANGQTPTGRTEKGAKHNHTAVGFCLRKRDSSRNNHRREYQCQRACRRSCLHSVWSAWRMEECRYGRRGAVQPLRHAHRRKRMQKQRIERALSTAPWRSSWTRTGLRAKQLSKAWWVQNLQ